MHMNIRGSCAIHRQSPLVTLPSPPLPYKRGNRSLLCKASRSKDGISSNVSLWKQRLDLVRALTIQAGKETAPWLSDLVLPWFMGSPRPLQDTVAPQQLADPDSKFAEVGGVVLHYKEVMPSNSTPLSGPPMVLLHGFNGSVFNWRLVMQDLADQAGTRVVAFDRPPFGLSSRPLQVPEDSPSPYSVAAGADFTVGLMDALGIEAAVLVGHSAGAGVVVETVARYPERVAGLVLVAPAVPAEDSSFLRQAGLGAQLRFAYSRFLLETEGPGLQYVRRQVRRRSEQVKQRKLGVYYDESDVGNEVVEGYLRPMKAMDWDRGYLLMLRSFSLGGAPSWREVPQPVLIVQGDTDTAVPLEAVMKLRDRIAAEQPKGSRLEFVELEHCGHLPPEEQPSQFVTSLVPFVSSLTRHSHGTVDHRASSGMAADDAPAGEPSADVVAESAAVTSLAGDALRQGDGVQ